MNITASDARTAALGGMLLMLPFAIMEAFMAGIGNARDAIVLFGLLWLLPMLALAVLLPIMRNARAGRGVAANPVKLTLGIGLVLALAFVWGAVVIDQLPCFAGVPNCD
jgi:hypothetical protein